MPENNTPVTPFPAASLLGYPRIGRRRELKKAIEAYWAGTIDAAALDAAGVITLFEITEIDRWRIARIGRA